MTFLNLIAFLSGVVGVIVIVIGLIRGMALIGKHLFSGTDHDHERSILDHIRLDIGRYIVLGLEFFIAKDIIETLVVPSVEDLLKLGALVIIRTIFTYFLTREIHIIESHKLEHRKVNAGLK